MQWSCDLKFEWGCGHNEDMDCFFSQSHPKQCTFRWAVIWGSASSSWTPKSYWRKLCRKMGASTSGGSCSMKNAICMYSHRTRHQAMHPPFSARLVVTWSVAWWYALYWYRKNTKKSRVQWQVQIGGNVQEVSMLKVIAAQLRCSQHTAVQSSPNLGAWKQGNNAERHAFQQQEAIQQEHSYWNRPTCQREVLVMNQKTINDSPDAGVHFSMTKIARTQRAKGLLSHICRKWEKAILTIVPWGKIPSSKLFADAGNLVIAGQKDKNSTCGKAGERSRRNSELWLKISFHQTAWKNSHPAAQWTWYVHHHSLG